ncbi:MAG: hypothetical protein LV481_16595 [Methylacidiphilales bacterium]|nr:hypothetical protein [Candidatus Methylacidiphilales bacterium]
MDAYPFDLVFAVAVASATIFLGFLPARTIRSGFFAREAFKAAAAWFVIAVISPLSVVHYPFILAVLCFIAWWNFRRDDTFTGKIWLSLASGLGISIGVLVILAVTPGSLPATPFGPTDASVSFLVQGWDGGQAWCLASLYLGGAIIGLAYVGYVLCREASTRAGIGGFIQDGLGLLYKLTLVRAAVVLLEIATGSGAPAGDGPGFHRIFFMLPLNVHANDVRQFGLFWVGICGVLILPALAYLARRAARFSSRRQPTRLLVAIMLVGLITEILARIAFL